MAKFERYFAQGSAEVTRRLQVDARDIADVGAGLEAAGMAEFGRALADVGKDVLGHIIEARTETQYLEGTSQWERGHTEFFKNLASDQDFEGYGKKYKTFAESLSKQLLKKKGLTNDAHQNLKKYMTNQQLASEKHVAAMFLRKQEDYSRASAFVAIDNFEKALDTDGALSAITHSQQQGFMSAEEAVKRKKMVRSNIDWYKGLQLIDTNPAGFEELADADADGKIDFTFLPNLSYDRKVQLRNRARTEHGRRLALAKQARKAEINQEQGRLMKLARAGELTDDIIRTSALDEFGTGSKKTFYDIVDKRAKAAIEGKEIPFLKSTPEVEAKILDQIRDPKSDITETDISELVGKGLSVDDADRLISRLDVFKSFWFKRADKFLKDQLGWSDIVTKFTHPEGALTYHLAMDELFNDIETKRLKDKDIYDRGREIAIPYIIDYWEKVLMLEKPQIERMSEMLTGQKAKPKPKTQVIKKKDLIDPEGIF